MDGEHFPSILSRIKASQDQEKALPLSQAELDARELQALHTKQATIGSGYNSQDNQRKLELIAKLEGNTPKADEYVPEYKRERRIR